MNDVRRFWTSAAGHLAAARALIATPVGAKHEGAFSASIFLLLGNSLETLMKAVLLMTGGGAHEPKEIGHNLRRLLERIEELGFKSNDPKFDSLVDMMHDTHAGHYFRYLGPGTKRLPLAEEAADVLDAHVLRIGSIIHPEQVDAAQPSNG